MRDEQRFTKTVLVAMLAAVLGAGCGEPPTEGTRFTTDRPEASRAELHAREEALEEALQRARAQVAASAESIDAALRPVRPLSGTEQATLRRFLNRDHLSRARSLGVRPGSDDRVEELQRAGRLVRLADTTELWVVRELEHSLPYVTPDARALLTEMGERFQAKLDSLGLPPLRFEVTSVLRTAESQASLRRTNSNAAGGISAHEYGTTLDIAYTSYAAPATPVVDLDPKAPPELQPHLRQMADAVVRAVATRRASELQAILGRVLREMQAEGKVLVTRERRQTVYHVTVGKRY